MEEFFENLLKTIFVKSAFVCIHVYVIVNEIKINVKAKKLVCFLFDHCKLKKKNSEYFGCISSDYHHCYEKIK